MKMPGIGKRTRRRGGLRQRVFAGAVALAVVGLVAPAPGMVPVARAAVDPPTGAAMIISYPESDSVELSGVGFNKEMTIKVVRAGRVIASATGSTGAFGTPGAGTLLVNRDTAFDGDGESICWSGRTPNIRGGDELQYMENNRAKGTTTASITMPTGPTLVESGVEGRMFLNLTGTAASGVANAPAANKYQVSVKLTNPWSTTWIIKAGGPEPDPGDGAMTIGPDSAWNATWRVIAGSQDATLAADPETQVEVMWHGPNPLNSESEMTIFEKGAAGGPSATCQDAPVVGGGMDALAPKLITAAIVDQGLDVSGFASDGVSSVEVEIRPAGGGAAIPMTSTLTPDTNDADLNQDWTARLSGEGLAALADGAYDVTATFVPADQTALSKSQTKSFRKDTTGPAKPTASRPSGRIVARSLLIGFRSPGTSQVCYSLDTTVPAWNSQACTIGAGATLRMVGGNHPTRYDATVVAYDEHGNPSAVAIYRYAVKKPVVQKRRTTRR